MKKSILISIILIVVLATAAILIVPRLGQASGVRVSADTVEKGEEAVQIEENEPAPVAEEPAVEEKPDTTPVYEATKTVLVSDGDGYKVTIDGEEIALTPDGSDKREGVDCGKYLAEDGSSYTFSPDGELIGIVYDINEYMHTSGLYMAGRLDAVNEDEAVGIARETLLSIFGEKFNNAVQTALEFGDDGMYDIRFNEMLGKDKNIRGPEYIIWVLPDGNVNFVCSNLSILLKNVRVCDLDTFTTEYIDNAAQEKLADKYGDNLISYTIKDITFKNINGMTQLFAAVDPELKNPPTDRHLTEYLFFDIPGVSD